jgi:hypothetical protein
MERYKLNYKKTLLYCLLILCGFTFSCDDDDDIPSNEVKFNNIQLKGANEVPAVTTNGTGTLNATYNRDTKMITYTINWTLGKSTDKITGMHFHGPAPTTQNAPVVIGLSPTSDNASGTFSGTTRALTDAEAADLLAGKWYLNIHSTTFPGGELRGQLID